MSIVARSYAHLDRARAKIEQNPMRVYADLDSRILWDPEGKLSQLLELACDHLECYRVPGKEKRRIAYHLKSARQKMIAAREAGDLLQAAYVASTTSWPILEGLWAANDRPMPSSGAVRAHVQDLAKTPPALESLWHGTFLGDARDRVQAAIEIIEWVEAILER